MSSNKCLNNLVLILLILKGQFSFQEEDAEIKVDVDEFTSDLKISDVIFIVLSQTNTYHKNRAELFRKHFEDQLKDVDKESQPKLFLTHEEWDYPGTWTVFPLLTELSSKFAEKPWVFICEDETRLDLHKLETVLRRFDHNKEYFLGHALRDETPTIIHHFAFHDRKVTFYYPDFGAGFLLSNALFKRLGAIWPDSSFRADFSIDAKHELAMFIWSNGEGVSLTDVPELCTGNIKENCATWYPLKFPECGTPVMEDELFIGVKTCEKYHKDRVKVVKDTWGETTTNIEYYSDKDDSDIPTVDLGIPNTERGHCGKTMAMIKRFYSHPEISINSWFLIADDDTLINLGRLRKLLSCYDPNEPIHLGEKYAYGVARHNWGYNYITGGGGMIFSKEAIRVMVENDMSKCGAVDSPDDMTLGMRFKHLDIPIVHSPYFHQARPDDYSQDFLNARLALSFHKHWNNDPYQVYKRLMQDNTSQDSHRDKSRDEL